MLASCRLIHFMAPTQDGHILAAVPLLRRDILDAAVSMNHVIPISKGMHPVTAAANVAKLWHGKPGKYFGERR